MGKNTFFYKAKSKRSEYILPNDTWISICFAFNSLLKIKAEEKWTKTLHLWVWANQILTTIGQPWNLFCAVWFALMLLGTECPHNLACNHMLSFALDFELTLKTKSPLTEIGIQRDKTPSPPTNGHFWRGLLKWTQMGLPLQYQQYLL